MAKSKTASFVVELRLVTYQNEQAILYKRFKITEKLDNKVLYHEGYQVDLSTEQELHGNNVSLEEPLRPSSGGLKGSPQQNRQCHPGTV